MRIRLMELRKAAGYRNRDDFAAKIGVNKYTYRSWESGAAMMNAEQLWNCAEALGTDPNTLMGWYEEHPVEERERPAAFERMDGVMTELSPEGQEVAVNVVGGLRATYPAGGGQPGVVADSA